MYFQDYLKVSQLYDFFLKVKIKQTRSLYLKEIVNNFFKKHFLITFS